MTASLNHLSDVIRLKERELHEIHEIRCNQLEQLIKDRDELANEAARRFEQLKEDFQYNLSLLESRDQELQILDKIISGLRDELHEKESDNKVLTSQIEKLQAMEESRRNHISQEKSNHKKILLELTRELESIRWATAEEIRTKVRDVEVLREEIRRLVSAHDEALEAQRLDLTSTFEQLLQQREASYLSREQEIKEQISGLECKFEILQTENSRLRSELGDAQRRAVAAADVADLREEQCRQLTWRFDDERQKMLATEDRLQRQLQQASEEALVQREKLSSATADYEQTVLKGSLETQREREARLVLEARVEDLRTALQQEQARQQRILAEAQTRDDALTQEVSALRQELARQQLLSSGTHTDLEEAVRRQGDVQRTCEELRSQLQATREQLRGEETRLMAAEAELRSLRREEEDLQQRLAQKDVALSALAKDAQESMRSAKAVEEEMEEAFTRSRRQYEDEAESTKQRIRDLETGLAAELSLRIAAGAQVSALEGLLREERAELGAVRLRLKLLEDRLAEQSRGPGVDGGGGGRSRYGNGGQGLQSPGFGYGFSYGADVDGGDYKGEAQAGPLSDPGSGPYVSSPMFSEDLGPASIPPSPMLGRGLPLDTPNGRQGVDSTAGPEDKRPKWALEQENMQLQAVIKEMRDDIEHMRMQAHAQQQTQQRDREPVVQNSTQHIQEVERLKEQCKGVECRLQQALVEVGRLREERTKLMDTNNQLRASLRRLESVVNRSRYDNVETPSVESTSSSLEEAGPDDAGPSKHRYLASGAVDAFDGPWEGAARSGAHAADPSTEEADPGLPVGMGVGVGVGRVQGREQPEQRRVQAWTDASYDASAHAGPGFGFGFGGGGEGLAGTALKGTKPPASVARASTRATASQLDKLSYLKSQAKARAVDAGGRGARGAGGGGAHTAPRRVRNYALGTDEG